MRKILSVLFLLFVVTTVMVEGDTSFKKRDNYWKLGVGSYGAGAGDIDNWSGFSYLDRARMDWVCLCFGNPPGPSKKTTGMLNEFLKINPDLKIVVRVWPISGLGYPENRYQATFLDYFYKSGVKEKLLANTSFQIKSVLDYIDRPENVMGFTFLEELPGHFTNMDLRNLDENKLGPSMERYRKQIEAERGKPLVWDEETRRWWALKFAEALNEINAFIKKESGGRWVFVWIQTNHDMLDFRPEGCSLKDSRLLPLYYSEIIKEGVADGFFAYPNNKYIWDRYLNLAKKNNWLFFSQVAHPGGMRLSRWDETLKMAKTEMPQNLGYFFYCEGDCKRGDWNDDPSIPDDDNFKRASIVNHYRHLCAQENVGMDVIEKHLVPEIEFGYDSEETTFGRFMALRVMVKNTRDGTWYLKSEDAVLKNVRLTLTLPEGYVLKGDVSPSASITLGDLGPGGYKTALWWPEKQTERSISKEEPIILDVKADNCPDFQVMSREPKSIIMPAQVLHVKRSGQKFLYPAYHLRERFIPTKIRLECIGDSATHPSLTVGQNKVIWMGNLSKGDVLEILPGMKAVLKNEKKNLVLDVSEKLYGREIQVSRHNLYEVTYGDIDIPSGGTKILVTIEPIEQEKIK